MPRAVSTTRLAEGVFGADAGPEDLDHLAIVVSQLRRKLEPEPGAPRYLPCVDADTYRFDPDGSGCYRR
jgi:DNA-binding response OmpR family regulator